MKRKSSFENPDIQVSRELSTSFDDVKVVSTNIDSVVLLADNVPALQDIQDSLGNINAVVTQIVPNLAEILEADTNAATATAMAVTATTQAGLADTARLAAEVAQSTAETEASNAQLSATAADISADLAVAAESTATAQAVVAITQAGIATTQAAAAVVSADEAEAARNAILGMEVATGAAGTQVSWDGTILTVPQGVQGVQGVQGNKGDTGAALTVKGTDITAAILLKVPTLGDFWVASDTGDGYAGGGSGWINTGQVRGPQGIQGIQGNVGIQGLTGPEGPQGIQGPQGVQGVQGATGPQGEIGIQGIQGIKGDTGLKGDMGQSVTSKGTDTSVNIIAKSGTLGDYWVASDSGHGYIYNGATWVDMGTVQGPQGTQGIKGDTGEQGIQGQGLSPKGTDTVINISAKVGTNGDYWIASDSGDGYIYSGSAWVNVGAVRGPQGIQGVKGDTGNQGIIGPQGTQGIQGLKGDKGDTGDTGTQGIQGIKGDTGTGISTVIRTAGTGASGTTDTYTITYTDASVSTFNTYNGADGLGTGDMLKAVYDSTGNGKVDVAEVAESVAWTSISSRPATFVPSIHAHVVADITDFPTLFNGTYGSLTGVPSTFTPSAHNHDDRYYTETEIDTILSGLDALPMQASQSGKYLTTNGTVASWSDVSKTAVGLGSVDNTSDVNKPVSTAQQTALNLKANLVSPTFTGTVGGVTAAMVGLGNVNNTADVNKPVSTAAQAILDLKADKSTTYTKAEVDNILGNIQAALDLINGVSV